MKKQLLAAFIALAFIAQAGAATFTVDGITYSSSNATDVQVVANTTTPYTGAITVPSTVTYQGTTYNVKGIGMQAFQKTAITSVTLSEGITTLAGWAFFDCPNLTSVTLPNSLTKIDMICFGNDKALTSLSFGPNLITINNPFTGSGITNFTVDANNPNFATFDGSIYNKNLTTLVAYPPAKTQVTFAPGILSLGINSMNGGTFTTLVIPNTVTTLGDFCFQNCKQLTSLTIGDAVANIGNSFYGCTALSSINIPASVQSINKNAFVGTSSLATVTVDPANTAFCAENNVLYNKAKTKLIVAGRDLTEFTFPPTVTTTEARAFEGCTKLTSITIPDIVTSMDMYTFSGCTSLAEVTIGSGLTTIPYYTFQNCSALTSINFPDQITQIGQQAFENCTGLKKVVCGTGVTSMGMNSFNNCPAIESIEMHSTTPPTLQTNTFRYYTAVVSVPSGSLDSYKTNSIWGRFKNWEVIGENMVEPSHAEAVSFKAGDDVVLTPTFTNLGSNTVTSVRYVVAVGDDSYTFVANGLSIEPNATGTATATLPSMPKGTYEVTISVDQVNGLNNKADNKACTFELTITEPVTVVESMTASEAASSYYDLQGRLVENPVKGVYVKVTNGKAVKIMK